MLQPFKGKTLSVEIIELALKALVIKTAFLALLYIFVGLTGVTSVVRADYYCCSLTPLVLFGG